MKKKISDLLDDMANAKEKLFRHCKVKSRHEYEEVEDDRDCWWRCLKYSGSVDWTKNRKNWDKGFSENLMEGPFRGKEITLARVAFGTGGVGWLAFSTDHEVKDEESP